MDSHQCDIKRCPQPAAYICNYHSRPAFLCPNHRRQHIRKAAGHSTSRIYQALNPQELSLAFQAEEYLARAASATIQQAIQAHAYFPSQYWTSYTKLSEECLGRLETEPDTHIQNLLQDFN